MVCERVRVFENGFASLVAGGRGVAGGWVWGEGGLQGVGHVFDEAQRPSDSGIPEAGSPRKRKENEQDVSVHWLLRGKQGWVVGGRWGVRGEGGGGQGEPRWSLRANLRNVCFCAERSGFRTRNPHFLDSPEF